ncbi:PAS domain-containing hybrid sensor histidine kinase/response regulator [Massilia agri]|uniref:histidine kinase n=1 Tax=Massilia agri TaxID=1886785 RepID=A0ABT2AQY9_9BURK|nr:ATP-binding protein [Massilia agri]MCS0598657.1 ATP-binding protein [Massilia agri]
MLSPDLFEAVFNSSPIGTYLLSPTPDAVVLAVNDTFLAASRRRREELVGTSLFVAFPTDPDDPASTSESELRQSFARVLASGQADRLPAQRYPIPVEQPDGSIVFEERFWSAISTPIFDGVGGIACILHTTNDVTEKVRSEAALRESEMRYRALSSAGQVVYRMNADWSEMHELDGRGFLKDSVGPRQLWLSDYVPADEQERVNAAVRQAIRTASPYELEHRVRRLDGSEAWTLSRAVPMFDAAGRVYEWIGAASDITERKAAEEKLREGDRRKDEFLAMLAHELRNPLAPISAAAEILQRMQPDEALLRRTSQIIGRQAAHMTGLIDDLLDVSRVTRGLVELSCAPVRLQDILDDAVEQATPLVRARQQSLAVAAPAGSPILVGDRKRLVQVLANLLNNAAKYTQEGGSVRLEAAVEGGRIRIDVADNGIGMAPELVARAFDLFAQADRSLDRALGGLGLGLALVRSLVELHGGAVECESAGPGQGSRFRVWLPGQDGARAAPALPEPAQARRHGPIRVLVVDDNVDAAETLSMLLEASGYQALVEHEPHAAIDRARRELPRACLLDIGLPGMDGRELARRLRADPATAGAMLVAVTGYGQQSDRDQFLAAGFDHHLVKPVDLGQLETILATVG